MTAVSFVCILYTVLIDKKNQMRKSFHLPWCWCERSLGIHGIYNENRQGKKILSGVEKYILMYTA